MPPSLPTDSTLTLYRSAPIKPTATSHSNDVFPPEIIALDSLILSSYLLPSCLNYLISFSPQYSSQTFSVNPSKICTTSIISQFSLLNRRPLNPSTPSMRWLDPSTSITPSPVVETLFASDRTSLNPHPIFFEVEQLSYLISPFPALESSRPLTRKLNRRISC